MEEQNLQKKCNICEIQVKLNLCNGCRQVYYCSSDCQKKDWKDHKIQCKEIQNSKKQSNTSNQQKKQEDQQKIDKSLKEQSLNNQNQEVEPQIKDGFHILNDMDTEDLIRILRKYYINIYRYIYFLDQSEADSFKRKNTYFHEQKHKNKPKIHEHQGQQSCCGAFFAKIYIPQNDRSQIERVCGEIFDKHKLQDLLPELLESLQKSFNAIKKGGQKDNLSWDLNAEQYILNEVLKEGCQRFFTQKIKIQLQSEQKSDCRQPLLLATPHAWEKQFPNIKLDFLNKHALQQLNIQNYTVIPNFMENPDYQRALFKELQFLERDGRFDEAVGEEQVRNDKIMWVGMAEIKKDQFPQIQRVAQVLCSMPFELNKKDMQMYTQASEMFQISYFKETGTYHKVHLDSAMDKSKDTGRTLSVLYCANIDHDYKNIKPGYIRIYKDKNNIESNYVDIEQKPGSLIIIKSRICPYEILPSYDNRRYLIRYWVNGPQDVVKNRF